MTAAGLIFSNLHDATVPELTRRRTMASIPFGGRYRLVDFALSNMVNAGISFKVGQRGAKAVKAESADVKALQEKVEAQDREIQELREMVEKLAAKA